jgi:hypothetical protein
MARRISPFNIIAQHRPPVYPGPLDQHLPALAGELRKRLAAAQEKFQYDTCKLPGASLDGMFDPRRIQHLLYVLFGHFTPDRLLSPSHSDLATFAQVASDYLTEAFRGLPTDSAITRFLKTPNTRGWDVKRKLVWAGQHAYLFRHECAEYLSEHGEDSDPVDAIDNFICEHCIDWCGLGVVDLLAGALDLSDEDRSDVRSWSERHTAPYRIASIQKQGRVVETLEAINVVNDQPYTIRIETEKCPFEAGQLVIGSLVPWQGEWYWSGTQQRFPESNRELEATVKKHYVEELSSISYRYCPARADQAREIVREHHEHFVAHYGTDLVIHPDGLSLAKAEKAWMKKLFNDVAEQDPANAAKVKARHKTPDSGPDLNLSDELLNHENGIAVFSDPQEGQQYLVNFNDVASGFRKQGNDLTEAEEEAIRDLIMDSVASPAFVYRMVQEHGSQAIGRAFLIRDFQEKLHLLFLLRRFKGAYNRNRYPALSFRE